MQFVQVAVQATLGQQCGVGAVLHDPAGVHDQDAVGVADGAEAVRDHEGGAALHQAFQGGLHQCFRFIVQGAGGLVQNEDARVFQDSAGNGDALALPARELHAALAHHRVVPGLEGRDEAVGIGGAGGVLHLLRGGVRAAIQDILAHRAGKKQRFLRHQAHLGTQVGQGVVAHVAAIDLKLPAGHVPETRNQVDEGGLARAAGADQGHHLPGGYVHVQVMQHRVFCLFALIGKRHVLEGDAARRAGQGHGPGRGGQVAALIQQFENAAGRPQRLLKLVEAAGQAGDGAAHLRGVEEEGDQVAGRQVARHHQPPAVPQHQGQGAEGQEAHAAGHQGLQAGTLQGRHEALLHARAVTLALQGFGGEALHHPHAADGLLGAGVGPGHGVLHLAADPPDAPADGKGGGDDQRNDRQGQQAQLRAGGDQQRHRAHQAHRLGGQLRQHGAGHTLHGAHVGGQATGQVTRLVIPEKTRRERQQMREKRAAQVGHHARPHPGQQVRLRRAEHRRQREDTQQQPHRAVERGGVGAAHLQKGSVDQAAEQLREHQPQAAGHQRGEQPQHEQAAVRAGVGQQPRQLPGVAPRTRLAGGGLSRARKHLSRAYTTPKNRLRIQPVFPNRVQTRMTRYLGGVTVALPSRSGHPFFLLE